MRVPNLVFLHPVRFSHESMRASSDEAIVDHFIYGPNTYNSQWLLHVRCFHTNDFDGQYVWFTFGWGV